jgi:hypothetical protein
MVCCEMTLKPVVPLERDPGDMMGQQWLNFGKDAVFRLAPEPKPLSLPEAPINPDRKVLCDAI